MTTIRSRTVPGITSGGVTRGGGFERIEYVTNGALNITRDITLYTLGKSRAASTAGRNVYLGLPTIPGGSADSDSTVRANGTTAIARSNPTSPSVNILTSAGELAADGLPSVSDFFRWEKTVRGLLRNTGRQHLSAQFAWAPLLSEVQAFAKQVRGFDRILREAQSDLAKRKIKVGYTFPSDVSRSFTLKSLNGRNWVSGNYTGELARGSEETTFQRKTWFEAEYLNFNPITPEQMSATQKFAQKARYVYGVHLTPAVLWELAPWSWAIDWVTNTGDIITAVSNSLVDGMVMRNGFVMHHTRATAEAVATGPFGSQFGYPYYKYDPCSALRVVETKKRFPAVPYFGFGSVGELTPRQLSIIAALGISRA